ADFVFTKVTPLPGLQAGVFEKTDPHTMELFDRMADDMKHATDLLVPALVQRNCVPRIRTFFKGLDGARGEPFVIQIKAAAQPVESPRRRLARKLDVIHLRDHPGLRHRLGKLPVVSEYDQTL